MKQIAEKNLKALWPEKWNIQQLLGLRGTIGSIAFAKKYQAETISESGRTFKLDWIDKCKDETRIIAEGRADLPEEVYAVMGVDLAAGQTPQAKFTVIFILGFYGEEHWLLDIYRDKIDYPTIKKKINEYYDKWLPGWLFVENNSVQLWLIQDMERQLPMIGMMTGRNKLHLIEGVPGLSVLVERQKLNIPWGNETTRQIAMPFVEELKNYPRGRTDDTIMAWWVAESGARLYGPCIEKPYRKDFLGRRRTGYGSLVSDREGRRGVFL